jgi:hypothetical protein
MSRLFDQAVEAVRKLSEEEQDAIATVMLDEIEDERRWNESFARSTITLSELAARAERQVNQGRCRMAGFDEL